MSSVAIIGGAGFVGSRLASALRDGGRRVVFVDVTEPDGGAVDYRRADVREGGALKAALEGCDAVYNLAAVHRDDIKPASVYDSVNVAGAYNVCAACREIGIERLIFTSSVAVYGNAAERRYGGAATGAGVAVREIEASRRAGSPRVAAGTVDGAIARGRASDGGLRRRESRQRLSAHPPDHLGSVRDGGQWQEPEVDCVRGQLERFPGSGAGAGHRGATCSTTWTDRTSPCGSSWTSSRRRWAGDRWLACGCRTRSAISEGSSVMPFQRLPGGHFPSAPSWFANSVAARPSRRRGSEQPVSAHR